MAPFHAVELRAALVHGSVGRRWEVRSKMERPGGDPKTGERLVVSARGA